MSKWQNYHRILRQSSCFVAEYVFYLAHSQMIKMGTEILGIIARSNCCFDKRRKREERFLKQRCCGANVTSKARKDRWAPVISVGDTGHTHFTVPADKYSLKYKMQAQHYKGNNRNTRVKCVQTCRNCTISRLTYSDIGTKSFNMITFVGMIKRREKKHDATQVHTLIKPEKKEDSERSRYLQIKYELKLVRVFTDHPLLTVVLAKVELGQ